MIFKTYSVAVFAAVALLVGCGGDSNDDSGSISIAESTIDSGLTGYSGETSASTIDDSNKEDITAAVFVGASRSVEIEIGSDASPLAATRTAIRNLPLSTAGVSERATTTSSGTYSDICDTGSITYTTVSDDSTGAYKFAYNYNNCTFSYYGLTTVYDGYFYLDYRADGSFYWDYDFTYTYGGESYSLQSTYYCDAEYNCGYEENFAEGGVSYRVSEVEVSGSSSSGYDVTATVYHEEYGYVVIEAEDLMVCDGGGFSAGTIDVTDSTNTVVLEVEFNNDCTTLNYSLDGGATTETLTY